VASRERQRPEGNGHFAALCYNRYMASPSPVHPLPGQLEYLLPGHNALETSLELAQSWTRKGKPLMLIETVKRVLETLDRNQILYAIIGGLAVSHHAVSPPNPGCGSGGLA
jgi:hypothetical protein